MIFFSITHRTSTEKVMKRQKRTLIFRKNDEYIRAVVLVEAFEVGFTKSGIRWRTTYDGESLKRSVLQLVRQMWQDLLCFLKGLHGNEKKLKCALSTYPIEEHQQTHDWVVRRQFKSLRHFPSNGDEAAGIIDQT